MRQLTSLDAWFLAVESARTFPVSAVVDGVGLNMTVMSYRDHVDLGVVTDRDQIRDPWPLVRAAERELEAFEADVCGSARRGRPQGVSA